MVARKEFEFAEVLVDRLFLESFANEQSPYHKGEGDSKVSEALDRFRGRLNWHISHSLSSRQKQVIRFYLSGKREREIAHVLGIKQQVVNIYKHRAIKKLQTLLTR
ncbi:MAG TPA: LuxR C-terminal-related transcriptional regulator [Candidatus Acidoferrum sp.]|nr:LuxR C-terminal-related transcriptional regulator [Candidatus Acidoferrum sp.]